MVWVDRTPAMVCRCSSTTSRNVSTSGNMRDGLHPGGGLIDGYRQRLFTRDRVGRRVNNQDVDLDRFLFAFLHKHANRTEMQAFERG